VRNIRTRRGSNVFISLPLFKDTHTDMGVGVPSGLCTPVTVANGLGAARGAPAAAADGVAGAVAAAGGVGAGAGAGAGAGGGASAGAAGACGIAAARACCDAVPVDVAGHERTYRIEVWCAVTAACVLVFGGVGGGGGGGGLLPAGLAPLRPAPRTCAAPPPRVAAHFGVNCLAACLWVVQGAADRAGSCSGDCKGIVHMDAMAFGMGCCCLQVRLGLCLLRCAPEKTTRMPADGSFPLAPLFPCPYDVSGTCPGQVTFQAKDLAESRYLYDQLSVLSPFFVRPPPPPPFPHPVFRAPVRPAGLKPPPHPPLHTLVACGSVGPCWATCALHLAARACLSPAPLSTPAPQMALTAGSPVFRGMIVDTDTRWDVIASSVDCRTPAERGLTSEVSCCAA
jgi:hypothetical protein